MYKLTYLKNNEWKQIVIEGEGKLRQTLNKLLSDLEVKKIYYELLP